MRVVDAGEDPLAGLPPETDVDLVLMDYRLGGDYDGAALAHRIRTRFQNTGIIFYSAEPPDTLRQVLFDNKIDGAYPCRREYLTERTVGIVTSLGTTSHIARPSRTTASLGFEGRDEAFDHDRMVALRLRLLNHTTALQGLLTLLMEMVRTAGALGLTSEATALDDQAQVVGEAISTLEGKLETLPSVETGK